jgi:hypothetical protein
MEDISRSYSRVQLTTMSSSKKDLTNLAKQKLDSGDFQEALDIYYQLYIDFPNEWNSWDTVFLLKCLRNNAILPESVDIENIVIAHIDEAPVKNLYVWYLFDQHVKNFNKDYIWKHEKGIKKITEISEQKDYITNQDRVPCPYTIGIFKLIKAYKKPNINVNKVQEWITKLEPKKLSKNEIEFTDTDGKIKRQASDYEEYYSILTSLLQKQEKHQECIDNCDIALSSISKFHYDNDIWFKRKKALSLIALGDIKAGKSILLQILQGHKGQKWFIYQEIAEIEFDDKNHEQALINCCKASLFQGDEDKKIKLYLIMARCYYKIQEIEKSKFLAELIGLIVQKYDLRLTDEVSKILNYYKIPYPKSEIENYLREKQTQLINICKQDQLRDEKVFQGKIHRIHSNQKSGHLNSYNNERYFFGMRDIQCNKSHLAEGTAVEFFLKQSQNQQGTLEDHAVITKII